MKASATVGRCLRHWSHRYPAGQPFVFVLAVLTGLVAGMMSYGIKRLIGWISDGVTSYFHSYGPNWPLLVVPLAGIMLCGWFQRRVVRADLTKSVARLGDDLHSRRYNLPGYLCYAPGVASSLTLGFGGSAGAEGPTAYAGAAIGSNVARIFGMSPRVTMILLGCGAGAGIAGLFEAPVGGLLFTLEVLRMELGTMSVVACLLACVAAAMTTRLMAGSGVDLAYMHEPPVDIELLPALMLLGAACGLFSLYYAYIMRHMAEFYERIPRPWVRNLVSGSVLSMLVFIFPAMYGEGYGVMRHILRGDISTLSADGLFATAGGAGVPVLIGIGILVFKAFACSAANSGGGVAGNFAPTLYAGCILGYTFAAAANLWLGLTLPVDVFAFCAMAGVMAGALQAPMMAIFLTAEMADASVLFLPLLIVTAISYGVIRLFRPPIHYTTY